MGNRCKTGCGKWAFEEGYCRACAKERRGDEPETISGPPRNFFYTTPNVNTVHGTPAGVSAAAKPAAAPAEATPYTPPDIRLSPRERCFHEVTLKEKARFTLEPIERRATRFTRYGAGCLIKYLQAHPTESFVMIQSGGGYQKRQRVKVDPADTTKLSIYTSEGMAGQFSDETHTVNAAGYWETLVNIDPDTFPPLTVMPQDWAMEVAREEAQAAGRPSAETTTTEGIS